MVTNDFVKELFVFGIFRKENENWRKKKDKKFYSSVWKHEWFLIQSIDWKRIRDADSQIKLLDKCESRFVGGLGGVMVNILVTSVTNGPIFLKF